MSPHITSASDSSSLSFQTFHYQLLTLDKVSSSRSHQLNQFSVFVLLVTHLLLLFFITPALCFRQLHHLHRTYSNNCNYCLQPTITFSSFQPLNALLLLVTDYFSNYYFNLQKSKVGFYPINNDFFSLLINKSCCCFCVSTRQCVTVWFQVRFLRGGTG